MHCSRQATDPAAANADLVLRRPVDELGSPLQRERDHRHQRSADTAKLIYLPSIGFFKKKA